LVLKFYILQPPHEQLQLRKPVLLFRP